MKKRITAIVLGLVMLLFAALASAEDSVGVMSRVCDLNGDGVKEIVMISMFNETDAELIDRLAVEMKIRSAGRNILTHRSLYADKALADELLTAAALNGETGTLWSMRGAVLENGLFYLERSSALGEGRAFYYEIYSLTETGMTLVVEVINPGYTDSEALYYGVNDEYNAETPIYSLDFTDESGVPSGMKTTLDSVLGGYGLTFDAETLQAELTEEQIAFEMTDADFPAVEEEPETTVTAAQPTAVPTAAPTAEPTPEPGPAYTHVRATGDVFVRTGAGRDYAELGVIMNGELAVYLNESMDDERPVTWYKIAYKDGEGWVSSMYSELIVSDETDEAEELDETVGE